MNCFHECYSCKETIPWGTPLCMRCGADFSFQPAENFLRDIVAIYSIGKTEIWVFPNAIFKDRGMAYWLRGLKEGGGFPFCEMMHDDLQRLHDDGTCCDTIVNSANNYLIPGSGLAKFLDEQIGPPYRQTRESLLSLHNGELGHGRSYFLPVPHGRVLRGIIEAISIRYRRDHDDSLERLPTRDSHVNACVYQALMQAHEHGCRSVAIPQLASRPGYSIYGARLAPSVMLNATLNAIVTFLTEVQPTALQRVCLHPGDSSAEEQMVMFLNRLKEEC